VAERNRSVQPRGILGGIKAQKPVRHVLPFVFGRMDARAVNGTWVSAAGMLRRPSGGECFEGRNPGALPI
jgi:hypothetical protein